MKRKFTLIGIILTIMNLIPVIVSMSIDTNQIDLSKQSANVRFASSIQINEVMQHLDQFQNIATSTNGNRAVKTLGFNRTLDYITDYLQLNTNFKITKTFFNLRNFQLLRNPTLSSNINGVVKTYTYSTNLASADFYHVQYSTSITMNGYVPITVIPSLGCSDVDWITASPRPFGLVALVKRGNCTFEAKANLASKHGAAALLFYNDGSTSSNMQPSAANAGQNNRVPVLSLSYNVGQSLVNAANGPSASVTVRMSIATDTAMNPVGNICADTITGDPTQTILIGSHSDSVTAGPGINDNGSGSAANLALAASLARLLGTNTYEPYPYRVRFCWWGAEELGLVGSNFHAAEAGKTSVIGERTQDYLVNINLDMLGSPNFIFGIYNGRTAPTNTPAAARPGSNRMTTLFQDWFTVNNLPWDYTNFDGRSDYGPFLAAGVAAGGLFSGADALKTVEQRNRYSAMLGSAFGGTSGLRQDTCYHQACDKTTNINKFALEKMVQASAYAIEYLGRQPDLKGWLYPTREIQELKAQITPPKYPYNSINEYFGFPYD